jgi:hypothetical protein
MKVLPVTCVPPQCRVVLSLPPWQAAVSIASNIIEHPDEAKYRSLKRGNARFDRSLGRHGAPAEQLLRCGGFRSVLGGDEAGTLVYEPSAEHDARLRGLLAALQGALRELG